jgi:LmbE family N-acetylglucosaminyl deacetylase
MPKRAKTTTTRYSFLKNSVRQWSVATKHLAVLAKKPYFGRLYLVVSLLILVVTVVFWSLLGAKLQQFNADQLIYPYFFEHSDTFQQALIPATHSFLLKWPLFLLIKLFGFSYAAFAVFTILCVLVTVACIVAGMALIERRPLALGTLCLALASVLLLVPALPHAGNLLPVNMAMITTRNLEYALYGGSLALLAWRPSFKSRLFWLGIIGLVLLIASDKLFMVLTLGGALLALIAYALASGWNLVSLSVKWLAGGLVATGLASLLLWSIDILHVTHIVNQVQAAPYQVVQTSHQLALSVCYMLVGILTNSGANPAFDTTVLKQMPTEAYHQLLGGAGPAFVINFLILLGGVYAMYWWLRQSFRHNKNKTPNFGLINHLVTVLIWSAVAAIAVFVLSSHYYAGDARYLTIWLFALFAALAGFVRERKWRPELLVTIGVVLSLGILAAMPTVIQAYRADLAVQTPFAERNKIVSQALAQHHVDVLLGDYWRVIPTKDTTNGRLNVLPLGDCTQTRDNLTSQAWKVNLRTHSFAYLLSLEEGQTDYPTCSLQQVTHSYGRPSSSVVLVGNISHPREMLLFYDHGINQSSPSTPQPPQGPATVVPIGLDELPYTTCPVPTIMQVVAHQDDDLLFMNPDLIHDVHAGHCIRTVYLTAGDAGHNQFYWLGRVRGAENAYSTMMGATDQVWIERIVKLTDNEFITVANPKGNSRISLVFMYLPDGNVKGEGFAASHFESLARLEAGRIANLNAVYGGSTYTSPQLTKALDALLHTYQPTEIRTQAGYTSGPYPDHSDHMAVGRYVKQAYQLYEQEQYDNRVMIPINYYIGYPIHQFSTNVSGEDLSAKEAAFFSYAQFDGAVCSNLWSCTNNPAYGNYLTRQYNNPY